MTAVRPKFDRPPVIEQAITVVFGELAGFGVGDFGLFWSKIRNDFPICEHAIPIETTIEQLPPLPSETDVQLVIGQEARLPRCLYRHRSTGEIVQIQNNRFTFNWAKLGDRPYPQSDVTVPRFVELFRLFQDFVDERNLGPLTILQAEITNVNIIAVSDFGRGFRDAPKAFEVPELQVESGILQPEAYITNVRHLIMNAGEPVGRLHTVLQPVINMMDQSLSYRLELTARSGRASANLETALAFFDLARTAINSTFLASAKPAMLEKWGMHHG